MGANGRFAISPMRRGFVFCGVALSGQDAAAAINAKKLRRRIAFPRSGLIEKKELEPDQLQHSPVASLGEMLFLKKYHRAIRMVCTKSFAVVSHVRDEGVSNLRRRRCRSSRNED